MTSGAGFAKVAAKPWPSLDELLLALATELTGALTEPALAELDRLGTEVRCRSAFTLEQQVEACREVLGKRNRFTRSHTPEPDNLMLDTVVLRHRGSDCLLAAVYVEVARRAGILLRPVAIPSRVIVGHLGGRPPVLIDPCENGAPVAPGAAPRGVNPWCPHEMALRVLNDLVEAYVAGGDLERAIQAAKLRRALPLDKRAQSSVATEIRALEARLN